MPFSTRVLAEFITYRTALFAYWANILILGATLFLSWGRATKAALIRDDVSAEVPRAICRRILIAQSLYALGALLCIFSTYWSIGFIVLLQLNYAIAPQFGKKKSE
jgi:uncharacterized membrane protein